jgi:tetratricopeptide (TPR) repeat protein
MRAYTQAFQDYGIDAVGLPPAESADLIRASIIRWELVRALDFWSLARRLTNNQTPAHWKQLLEIAKRADADSWRNQLRDAVKAEDRKPLLSMAASADIRHLPAQTLVLLARTLDKFSATEQAVALLRQAQLLFPADLWINETLGSYCLYGLRPPQHDEALRYYAAVLALRPGSSWAMIAVADALDGRGSNEEALAACDRAIELDRKNPEAWWKRARSYHNLDQYAKAIDDSNQAIELNPKFTAAWIQGGLEYCVLGHYDKALAYTNKAIELDPNHWWAWNTRGSTYYRLQRYDKALADLNGAIELDSNSWTCSTLAWVLADCPDPKLRDARRAVELAKKAVELTPKDAEGTNHFWHILGMAHYRAGNWKKAVAAHDKSIELNPKNPAAWNNRGILYTRLGQYQEAVSDCSKAIELDPKTGFYWGCRAWAYKGLHQYDKALSGWSQEIVLDPKHAGGWNNRGMLHQELHHYDKAIADHSKAIELDTKDATAWYNRGWAYASLGEWDTAIADFTKSIELEPDRPIPWLEHFQGHFAPNRLLLLSHEDHAEAAFADLLQKLIGTNDGAGPFGNRRLIEGGHCGGRRLVQEVAHLDLRPKQHLHVAPQLIVAGTRLVEIGGALDGRCSLKCFQENRGFVHLPTPLPAGAATDQCALWKETTPGKIREFRLFQRSASPTTRR